MLNPTGSYSLLFNHFRVSGQPCSAALPLPGERGPAPVLLRQGGDGPHHHMDLSPELKLEQDLWPVL